MVVMVVVVVMRRVMWVEARTITATWAATHTAFYECRAATRAHLAFRRPHHSRVEIWGACRGWGSWWWRPVG